ncbi:MAG: hypothetical protein R2847_08975 [Bacteroidia bacterium]
MELCIINLQIDAHSSNADLAYVISGSTNFTDGQLNTDANNMIIIQINRWPLVTP